MVAVITLFSYSFTSAEKQVQVVKMPWLDSVLQLHNDTTYVLNFWATWCVPCVAELPIFDQIQKTYSKNKVRVVLISLDYIKKRDEVLIPFLTKKRIQSEVVLLNEPDANGWIDKVDRSWTGALPATLVVNNNTSFRHFLEKELNFELLDSLIQINIKKR